MLWHALGPLAYDIHYVSLGMTCIRFPLLLHPLYAIGIIYLYLLWSDMH